MKRADLYERMYAWAAQIPPGCVATYGQLAFLAGIPRGARLCGQAMCHVPDGYDIPCHRVVTWDGRCAPGFAEQRSLLEKEGVTFLPSGQVDMKRHVWVPIPSLLSLKDPKN